MRLMGLSQSLHRTAQDRLRHIGVCLLRSIATVLLKPGVMDPVAESVGLAARDLGIDLFSVRTFRRYYAAKPLAQWRHGELLLQEGARQRCHRAGHRRAAASGPFDARLGLRFQLVTVPLRDADDAGLMKLSRDGQLSLSLAEMQTIQAHFQTAGRDPTDVELETIAQTWCEHCSHKTLKGHDRVRRPTHRQPAQGDDLRRHAGDPPPARRRRLVRQRLRGQRRRRAVRRRVSTSASRSRRTTIRRPSNPTAARTPGSAA